jgi:hypothetical protein
MPQPGPQDISTFSCHFIVKSGIMKSDSMGLIPSFRVEMDIYDVLYLSYLVPEERLRPAVPDRLPFAVTSAGKTVISIVIFHSRNVRASFFPLLHFTYDQANIRTYVLDPLTGKESVFFLKSGITSPFIASVTSLLRIPWHSISMNLDARYANESVNRYAVEGSWGDRFKILVNENREPLTPVGPFQTAQEAARFLTGPSVGFYGQAGGLIRFEVHHSEIRPLWGRISEIELPLLARPGLLTEDEMRLPFSTLVAAHARFTVFMPPSKVAL